jgi:hypothetical protein
MKPENLLDSDGKELPKSYYKTLNKLVLLGKLKHEYATNQPTETRVNPYSGVTVLLTPLAASLADWIVSDNPIGEGKGFTRSDWDNARYTFNVCWPDAYYKLID